MFEDIDEVIQLYFEGLSVGAIAEAVGLSTEDVQEIIDGIDIISLPILFGETLEQSQAIEQEIIRLNKIGYDIETIAEKVNSNPEAVRYVIDNSCGGCKFPR